MHGGGRSSFPWLRAAAMIVILAGAALFSYQFFFSSRQSNPISQLSEKNNNLAKTNKPDSTQSPARADTILHDSAVNNITSGLSASSSEISANATTNSQKYKITTRETVTIEPGAFASINPDSGRIGEITKDDHAKISVESAKPSTVTTAPPDDNKKNKDVVMAPAGDVTIAKKNEADKESDFLFDQSTYKGRADSNGIAQKKQQARSGIGLYRNNSTNIFRGQITDANNTPLPFANVTNTRDNVGTYSDAKGYFVLVSPDSIMDVQVRSLGYENSRIRIRGNLSNNAITLQEDKSLSAKILDTVKRNYRTRDGNLAFEEPEPADGWASYDSYLANNQNEVPEAFDSKRNSGSDAVELSFEVNKNGEPVNIRVEKSLCDKCDKEAIRLVREGPKWKRKAKKGKRTTVTVPFIKTD